MTCGTGYSWTKNNKKSKYRERSVDKHETSRRLRARFCAEVKKASLHSRNKIAFRNKLLTRVFLAFLTSKAFPGPR